MTDLLTAETRLSIASAYMDKHSCLSRVYEFWQRIAEEAVAEIAERDARPATAAKGG